MNFRTNAQFVVTRGTNNKRIGAACSIEHAEGIGERLRPGTSYTIWQRIDGQWSAIRERIAG